MYSCFFIGHRDAPTEIQEKLNEAVEYLARKCHVTEFIVEHHGNFNAMATAAVQRLKRLDPTVTALRLLCYFPADKPMVLPAYFDDFYYPLELLEVPDRYAIEKANHLMIDQCGYLVAYVCRSGGNAAKFLRRGLRLEKKGCIKIINLAVDQSSTG